MQDEEVKKKKKGSTFEPIMDALKVPSEPVAQQQIEQAPIQAPNPLLDILRKRQQDANDEATATAIASGVGALLSGDASGPITDYGLSQTQNVMNRKRDLQDQETNVLLADMKAKSPSSTSRRYQMISTEDAEGNQVWAKFDRTTGEVVPTDLSRGLSPFVGVDPRYGEITKISKSKGKPTSRLVPSKDGYKAPFSVKEEKDVKEGQNFLSRSKTFQNSKAGVVSSNQIIDLLNTQEPINDSGVGTLFLRAFGEVGALSDRERAQFFGSPALSRRFDRMLEKAEKGTLNDDDRQDMLDTAMQLRSLNAGVLQQEIDNVSKIISSRTGVKDKRIKKTLSPLGKIPQQKAKRFAPSRPQDSLRRKRNGRWYRFTKNPETGEYDGVLDE